MKGVWTALVTPFQENNEIDWESLKKILHGQVQAGITGVVVAGTTGESPTLSIQEKKTLICFALEQLKNTDVQVVAGTGTNNTEESLSLSVWAAEQGVAGVMLVTPYYNKPSQAGLEAHFRKIADAVSTEVIVYHVPGRTGVSLTPETIVNLASHPKITTLKEATGNVAFTSELFHALADEGQTLDILSGDDATFLPLLSIGASGTISVTSNLFPKEMVSIQNALLNGKLSEALKIHQHCYPIMRDLFIESNPVPIKHALARAGWCTSKVRPPLAPLSRSNAEKLNKTLDRLKALTVQSSISPRVPSV